jgi:hypothetical protein
LLIIGGVVGLLVAGLTVAVVSSTRFQKRYRPPAARLPDAEDVAEMRAGLEESRSLGFPRTPEFVVPSEYVPVILRWLQPGDYVPDPPIFPHDELGQFQIRTKSRGDIRIRFYWAGKNPAVYTFDGTDYFWGNGKDESGEPVDGGIWLGKAVRAAYECSKR